jgi:hypothetical protein
MRCDMCLKPITTSTCRQIPLYVFGSEGITICHDCEMQLCGFVRDTNRAAHLARNKGNMTHANRNNRNQ